MKWSFLILIVLLASCTIERKIYSSIPVNNPSLQGKNDFSVNATVSAPKGFDVNGGYALTNHLAIIAGGFTHKNEAIETAGPFSPLGIHDDSSNLEYRHHGITIGAGAYFPLSKLYSPGYFSFFGGISTGSFRMNEEMYENQINSPGPPVFHFYKSRVSRYFLQAGLSHYGKYFEASITTKYNLVGYNQVNSDYTNSQLADFHLPPFTTPEYNSFLDIVFDLKVFFSNKPRWGIQFFNVVTARLDNDNNGVKQYDYYFLRMGTGIFFRGFL